MNPIARIHLEEAERRVEESQTRQRALAELPGTDAQRHALDLEPIKARLALRGEDRASYLLDHALGDLEALIEEIERFRA